MEVGVRQGDKVSPFYFTDRAQLLAQVGNCQLLSAPSPYDKEHPTFMSGAVERCGCTRVVEHHSTSLTGYSAVRPRQSPSRREEC